MPSRRKPPASFLRGDLDEIPDWCFHDGDIQPYDLDDIIKHTRKQGLANARLYVREGHVQQIHRACWAVTTPRRPTRPHYVYLEHGIFHCHEDSGRTTLNPCGHILAVMLFLEPPKVPKRRIKNVDRGAKHDARKARFTIGLRFLVKLSGLAKERRGGRGRKGHGMGVMVFCITFREMTRLPLRDACSLLEAFKRFLPEQPDVNAVSRYSNKIETLRLLEELNLIAATCARHRESHFAIDGTGLSTEEYGEYNEDKHRRRHPNVQELLNPANLPKPSFKDRKKNRVGTKGRTRKYATATIISGTETGIIPALCLSRKPRELEANIPLYLQARRGMHIERLSGDELHYGRALYSIEDRDGIEVLAPPHKGIKKRPKKFGAFADTTEKFLDEDPETLIAYGLQENAESTNASLKRRSRPFLSNKNWIARQVQAQAMALAHNIDVLLELYFQHGDIPDFEAAARHIAESRRVDVTMRKADPEDLDGLKLTSKQRRRLTLTTPLPDVIEDNHE